MKKLLFIAACLAVLIYTAVDTKKKPSDVTLNDVGTVAEKTADEIKNSKSSLYINSHLGFGNNSSK